MNENISVGDTVYYEYSADAKIVIKVETYYLFKRYILADKDDLNRLSRASRSQITKINPKKDEPNN